MIIQKDIDTKCYVFIMEFIKRFITKIKVKDIPMPLGRWRIEKCNTKIRNKIDLSNEDHCGPCGQYALDKRISNAKIPFSKNPPS
jgi:hypothetical protein